MRVLCAVLWGEEPKRKPAVKWVRSKLILAKRSWEFGCEGIP